MIIICALTEPIRGPAYPHVLRMNGESGSVRGFTLVELIIVATIISILVGVGLLVYTNVQEKARSAEAYSVLADIAAGETAYYVENNAYTSTWSDLNRFDSAPVSDNFNYSLSSSHGWAQPRAGSIYYQMCFNGASKWTSTEHTDSGLCS
jgi:prepilin-type N-terminal cleavage/methylation domain-containing protein